MFEQLEKINEGPKPFQFYTASDLWTDEHTSAQMLSCHLNDDIDLSSRNKRFINQSVEWISSRFNIGKDTNIADFGCGPGLYAMRLAKRQANVTGIDFSTRSIEYAKKVAIEEQLNINYKGVRSTHDSCQVSSNRHQVARPGRKDENTKRKK